MIVTRFGDFTVEVLEGTEGWMKKESKISQI
jgi:hypothetical protein